MIQGCFFEPFGQKQIDNRKRKKGEDGAMNLGFDFSWGIF
jgi:hypothetical protein